MSANQWLMRSGAGLLGVLLALGVGWGSPSPAHGEGVTLIEEGKARAVIVTARGSGRGERRMLRSSRDVLVAYLKHMSGVRLERLSESDLGDARVEDGRIVPEEGTVDANIDTFILVGEGELARELGVSNDQVGHSGIRIKTTANALVLAGTTDGTSYRGGTMYAAHKLLEELGYRYLWPGELGLVVPESDTVRVDALDIAYTPPVGQRNIRTMRHGPRRFGRGLSALEFTEEDAAEQRERARLSVTHDTIGTRVRGHGWSTWHGLGGSLGIHGGHAGGGLRDADEQLEKNPEWFALQADGTRDQRGTSRWRLCVSNMDLIDHVAQGVIERVNESPRPSISLSPNDGGRSSFCMCEDCKALDPEDAPKVSIRIFERAGSSSRETIQYPSLSDRYIWYWNRIAERVTEEHPELLLVVDAYSAYATPPVRETVHPNLVIRYVPRNTEGWTGWQEAGAQHIFWRPNILHSGYRQGTLNHHRAREIAELISFFGQRGMNAIDIQGIYNNWATMGLNYYVAARYIWDPFQNYDELIDDYARMGFGPAAESIKAYFNIVEDLGRSLVDHWTPEAIAELRGHLDEAKEATAEDETIRERIQFLRVGLEFTAKTAKLDRKAHAVENESREVDLDLAQQVRDRRWLLMRHIFEEYPRAVNVALVEGNNSSARGRWRRTLGTSGRSERIYEHAEDYPFVDRETREYLRTGTFEARGERVNLSPPIMGGDFWYVQGEDRDNLSTIFSRSTSRSGRGSISFDVRNHNDWVIARQWDQPVRIDRYTVGARSGNRSYFSGWVLHHRNLETGAIEKVDGGTVTGFGREDSERAEQGPVSTFEFESPVITDEIRIELTDPTHSRRVFLAYWHFEGDFATAEDDDDWLYEDQTVLPEGD